MKKALIILASVLVVLVLAVVIGAGFFMGNIVKAAVNNVGPRVTQSKVELATANLSPFSGTGTFKGLVVGNPAGWSENPAFSLGEVRVDVEPGSLFKDTIVINELVIDRPEFNYETKLFSSNIKDLLANIEKYTGKGGEAGTKEGPPKKFIVKKLRFTNGKATVGVGATAVPVPLPEIRLDDIGMAEGGVSGSRVAMVVMRDVLTNIAAATANALSKDGGKAALEKAKDLGNAVKDLFKKP
jgi:hypothetical protein